MLNVIAHSWWTFLLRGVFAILFGIIAFLNPVITGVIFMIMLGAYLLVDGLAALIAAFSCRRRFGSTVWLLLIGLLGIAAGVLIVKQPGLALATAVLFVGWWAVVRGVFEIVASISAKSGTLALEGILSLIFGLILVLSPLRASVGIIWVIGIWAIIAGGTLCAFAFRLRRHKKIMASQ